MTRPFTGWHMTAIVAGFFVVVVAVNFTMAGLASRTFGGTVVDNSYVASQNYNGWLAEARLQKSLGWTTRVDLGSDRRLRISITSSIGPVPVDQVNAVAIHPLGRQPERRLRFAAVAAGILVSTTALPPGRYLLRISVESAGKSARYEETIPA
jgi:nitrogen fixation protein FixH